MRIAQWRRAGRAFAACVMIAGLAACPRRAPNPAASPSGTGSAQPPSVVLLVQNVTLQPDAARAVRVGFSPADPTVRLIANFPDTGAVVGVCALSAVSDPVPAGLDQPGCLNDLGAGVRESLAPGSRLGAVALWVRSGPPLVVRIQLEYSEGTRDIDVRIPVLMAPASPSACTDNACNPFLEMTPVRGGEFRARVSWAGGPARLALLEGRVLARSFTATGIPYGLPAQETGRSPLSITTRLSAPAEYALVFDRNATDATGIDLSAHWP